MGSIMAASMPCNMAFTCMDRPGTETHILTASETLRPLRLTAHPLTSPPPASPPPPLPHPTSPTPHQPPASFPHPLPLSLPRHLTSLPTTTWLPPGLTLWPHSRHASQTWEDFGGQDCGTGQDWDRTGLPLLLQAFLGEHFGWVQQWELVALCYFQVAALHVGLCI